MCGIAGIYSTMGASAQSLERMTDRMRHRGPDGFGHWISDDGHMGLAHRRLSIIDLSEDGHQPMHFAGRYVITFNGEIYNYLELRRELELKGTAFKSKTDTEVLVALYAEYGPACLQKLEGMFAFVIYDRAERRLFGARDRFGEKPFYYHRGPGGTFVFASEIKALFAYGIPKKINNSMLANFMLSNYAISNPQDLRETFYEGVFKLPAACYFTMQAGSDPRINEYWKLEPTGTNSHIQFGEAKEEFRLLLSQSVSRRMRSDVPIGSSLSGGLDSSSIVCLLNEANSSKQFRQTTFSARFKDFGKDEGAFMEKVIEKTGAEAHFTWPDEEGFIRDFESLCYFQDEPFPSASIYAQYCVMRKAGEENVTVMLDGQGADETLAGYEYYLDTYLNGLKSSGSNRYGKELELLSANNANFKPASPGDLPVQESRSLKQLVKDTVRPLYRIVNPAKYKAVRSKPAGLLTSAFRESLGENWKYDFSAYDQHNVKAHLWHSVKYHNLEDLLRFSDRNSMAHGREVRLPFLSTPLVEFLFTLPVEFLVHQGWTKYILRESLQGILPAEIAWRKDKIGYEPPQKKWLQNPVFVEKAEQGRRTLISNGIVNEGFRFTEDHKWSALMMQMVYNS